MARKGSTGDWWNADAARLALRVKKRIKDAAYDELLLSAISVWEFARLLEKDRIRISRPAENWIAEALAIPGLRQVGLTTRLPCIPPDLRANNR